MNTQEALEKMQRNEADLERRYKTVFTRQDIHRHALLYFDHVTRLAQSTNKGQAKIHFALAQEEHDAIGKLASKL